MIKIPGTNKRFSQPNNSDLFGNVWYTRNINFDEEGYLKLSSRCAQVITEKDDSNFDLPLAIGRQNNYFHVVTQDNPYEFNLSESSFSVARDTSSGAPGLTGDSWGAWFQNRWHATTATEMWYQTSNGSGWTNTSISLSTGKVHPIEVFRNRASLAVGNGNTVKLLSTAYATTVTLTIPSDFEVIGLSYSSTKMAVVTKMSDTAAGQNQEAYLFVWDGVATSANSGYPTGSDSVEAIVAYKSSWVILTRTGELKYFNGGGFETLATLPFYYRNITWGDATNRNSKGAIMTVEGDVIYINIGNDLNGFGNKGERYLQNNPAGVLCYDPKVGLYHRYSPSISPASWIDVPEASVNTTTDIFTKSSGTLYETGTPIKYVYDETDAIGGLTAGQVYYIIKHTSTTFSLAETYQDAIDGNKINVTSQGATNNYFLALNPIDFGTTRVRETGAVVQVEQSQVTGDHLVFGADINDYNTTNNYAVLNLTVPGFENRGYFVIPKISSADVEDKIQRLFLKYRTLDVNDSIIVKYKEKDVLGLPTSTLSTRDRTSVICTWTDANTMTTLADLSAVKTYMDTDGAECEVEILAGNGSGVLVQLSSITENAGTYTLNLAEDVPGVTAGYYCDIMVDNWRILKTKDGESSLTSANTNGWAEFPVNVNSKWVKFKVELRGSETAIEELSVINKTQIPAQ
jgi:hypothetical protein